MSFVARPRTDATSVRRLWFPGQHGAWAMLAVPFLLGIAASAPSPWQLVLAVAAIAGYLASATAQAWLRARRRPNYVFSLVVYATAFALAGLVLVLSHPALLATALVVGPAGAIALAGARPGTRRELAGSLAQVAIVLTLVPAAAWLAGPIDPAAVLALTLVAAGYLVGTVLVVRSVIRERDSVWFALLSFGFHAALVLAAAAFLPPAYAAVAAGLAARAAILPILRRRRAGTSRPLRPVHAGAVEIIASLTLVTIAFAVPL